MTTSRQIVVLGSGGHGRVVADICRTAGRSVCGFVDPKVTAGELIGSIPVLGGDELLDSPDFIARYEFALGVGDQDVRRNLAGKMRARAATLATVAHSSAVIAPDVRIGAGTVFMAGSIVNPGSVLGEIVVINTAATVDHDAVLEEGVQVCPGAHLAGGVTCREYAFIGMGANVIQGLTIGARAIVGAGAVVISDVPDGVTVVGCPARVSSKRG